MGDCESRMEYQTDRLVRWLIPGEVMHLVSRKSFKGLWPDFFRFFNKKTDYYIFSKDDLMPTLGLLLTIGTKIFDPKMVKYYLFRNSRR